MSISVSFDLTLLKAAALCASQDPTRYYLCGVEVRCKENVFTITATDGHRLISFNPPVSYSHVPPMPFNVIIPLDIIKNLKVAKKAPEGELILESNGTCAIKYQGRSMVFQPIDGTFPDWKRVVPTKVDGTVAQFNAHYLADFAKINDMYRDDKAKCLIIGHNGSGPALVYLPIGVDNVAVIMPVRHGKEEVPTAAPSWAVYPEPAKEQAA